MRRRRRKRKEEEEGGGGRCIDCPEQMTKGREGPREGSKRERGRETLSGNSVHSKSAKNTCKAALLNSDAKNRGENKPSRKRHFKQQHWKLESSRRIVFLRRQIVFCNAKINPPACSLQKTIRLRKKQSAYLILTSLPPLPPHFSSRPSPPPPPSPSLSGTSSKGSSLVWPRASARS